jgi:hypothetical protein
VSEITALFVAMSPIAIVIFLACLTAMVQSAPQDSRQLFADLATPRKPIVQIKRLINQQERDGSYTYGFEAEDGTFKVETRSVAGIVSGKYGYIDTNNELKVVDYSVGKNTGFEARGDFPKAPEPLPVPTPVQPFGFTAQDLPVAPQQTAEFNQAFKSLPNGIATFSDPTNKFQFSFPDPNSASVSRSNFGAQSASADSTYVPSVALDGFSDDADQDGFVDPVPASGFAPQSSATFAVQQSAPATVNLQQAFADIGSSFGR